MLKIAHKIVLGNANNLNIQFVLFLRAFKSYFKVEQNVAIF